MVATSGTDTGDGRRTAPPSAVARARLAERLGRDVADLRVRIEEATLRADVYLAAGRPDIAREVVDEQQGLLGELHDRVASSLAAGAVEAEAEAVLGASDASALLAAADGPPTPDSAAPTAASASVEADPTPGAESARRTAPARLTASAMASVMAALAFLAMLSSPPGPRTLAAGVNDTADEAASPASDGAQAERAARPLLTGPTADAGEITGPADRDTASRRSAPRAPSIRTGLSVSAGLEELQRMVDGLLSSVVRALEGLDGVAAEPVEGADRPEEHSGGSDGSGWEVFADPDGDPEEERPVTSGAGTAPEEPGADDPSRSAGVEHTGEQGEPRAEEGERDTGGPDGDADADEGERAPLSRELIGERSDADGTVGAGH